MHGRAGAAIGAVAEPAHRGDGRARPRRRRGRATRRGPRRPRRRRRARAGAVGGLHGEDRAGACGDRRVGLGARVLARAGRRRPRGRRAPGAARSTAVDHRPAALVEARARAEQHGRGRRRPGSVNRTCGGRARDRLLQERGHVEVVVGVDRRRRRRTGRRRGRDGRRPRPASDGAARCGSRPLPSSHRSKPAAMTVTRTSSPISSSMTVPKMMLASGWATPWMTSAASFTSNRPRSLPPAMDSRIPRAPSIDASSSGLEMAARAALSDRPSPAPVADAHQGRAGVAT